MANGIPGKPGPVPTSNMRCPSICGMMLRLSIKWREIINSGSRTAVKLYALFHLINKAW